MSINFGFNTRDVSVDDYAPIPEGTYVAILASMEERNSKAGNRFIMATLQVVQGEHKGRNVITNLNLWHPDSNVRDIAARDIAKMAKAVGVDDATSSDQLIGKPMLISVGIEGKTGQDRNTIKSYSSVSSVQPTHQAPRNAWENRRPV